MIRKILSVLLLGLFFYWAGCGYKTPPLPPLPDTPQKSDPEPRASASPIPSPTPSVSTKAKKKSR